MLHTQHYFVYRNESDIKRLLNGLAKAGVPQLPADVDPHSKDRLTEPEIKDVGQFEFGMPDVHSRIVKMAAEKASGASKGMLCPHSTTRCL